LFASVFLLNLQSAGPRKFKQGDGKPKQGNGKLKQGDGKHKQSDGKESVGQKAPFRKMVCFRILPEFRHSPALIAISVTRLSAFCLDPGNYNG
jgi:hypothetical protein